MSQTVGAATTHYVLDPGAGLTQVLADGTNTYLYGNERLAQYQAAMQYFGADGLGSVRQIIDASAAVVGSSRYDPFGNVMSQGGTATSVFAFAGEQYDAATGLEYLRARYYSSAQGRFTTRDVWEGDYQWPQALDDWVYATNNPLRYADPTGHQSQEDFRVRLEDAGAPQQRARILQGFKETHWSYGILADPWNVLGREVDFVNWMQSSNRLTVDWWNESDRYLTASRFAGQRVAEYVKPLISCEGPVITGRLEPGVAEFAALILAADTIAPAAKVGVLLNQPHIIAAGSTFLNYGFWSAHNAGLREGVRRADARGLRQQMPLEERSFVNFVLYNVLEPGDQCAAGSGSFCAFTFPIELRFGTDVIYPNHYPATRTDLDRVADWFGPIYKAWQLLGSRAPNAEIHLIDESLLELKEAYD